MRDLLPPDAVDALERFHAAMQWLRAPSRPDDVYLDIVGVLPVDRHQGIATALMEAGVRLPVAIDTDNDAFYTPQRS